MKWAWTCLVLVVGCQSRSYKEFEDGGATILKPQYAAPALTQQRTMAMAVVPTVNRHYAWNPCSGAVGYVFRYESPKGATNFIYTDKPEVRFTSGTGGINPMVQSTNQFKVTEFSNIPRLKYCNIAYSEKVTIWDSTNLLTGWNRMGTYYPGSFKVPATGTRFFTGTSPLVAYESYD